MKYLITVLLLFISGCNSFNQYTPIYNTSNVVMDLDESKETISITPMPIIVTPKPITLKIPIAIPSVVKVSVKKSDVENLITQYDLCPRKKIVDVRRAAPIPFKELEELKTKFKNKPVEYQKAVIDLLTEHISSLYGTVKYNRELITERDQEYRDSCTTFKNKVINRKN